MPDQIWNERTIPDATTLFTDSPMVTVDVRENLRRVHFWAPGKKMGFAGVYELAGMSTEYVSHAFYIDQGCPEVVAVEAFRVWQGFMKGVMPVPTHTVTWQYGAADFTAITPEGNTQ